MSLKYIFDRKNVYIYPWYIADLVVTKDIKSISGGNKIKEGLVIVENDFFSMYYDIESMEKMGRYYLKQIVTDKRFYNQVISQIYSYSDKLLKFGEMISHADLKSISNKKLLSLYSQYVKTLGELRMWGFIPPMLDGGSSNFLTDYLQEKFNKYLITIGRVDKAAEYYTLLSSGEKASEVQQEEVGRLDLLLQISRNKNAKKIITDIKANKQEGFDKKYPDIYRRVKKHLRDFGWLTYGYSGPAMRLDHLFKLIGENLKDDIADQKKRILDHYRNIKKDKKQLIKDINLSQQLAYLFDVSAEFMFIKDYRKGIYQQSYLFMDPVIVEIAHRLDLTPKAVKYLVIDEIADALSGKSKVDYKRITEARQKKCCYCATNGKIQVYQEKECDAIIKKLIGKEQKYISNSEKEEITELKGMVAFAGKVKGVVKIVLVPADMDKINPGDVLVSSSTNPDLILAMKRAAAFVTDLGGITSHAAIVSRELKKPCIVGTRLATHLLRDGDLVEVDAQQGVVRKLNK